MAPAILLAVLNTWIIVEFKRISRRRKLLAHGIQCTEVSGFPLPSVNDQSIVQPSIFQTQEDGFSGIEKCSPDEIQLKEKQNSTGSINIRADGLPKEMTNEFVNTNLKNSCATSTATDELSHQLVETCFTTYTYQEMKLNISDLNDTMWNSECNCDLPNGELERIGETATKKLCKNGSVRFSMTPAATPSALTPVLLKSPGEHSPAPTGSWREVSISTTPPNTVLEDEENVSEKRK